METPESSDCENSETARVQYCLRVSPQAQHQTVNLRATYQPQRNPERAQKTNTHMSEQPRVTSPVRETEQEQISSVHYVSCFTGL